MKDGVIRDSCPVCGGTICVSALYQYSHEHRVLKGGRLSKRFKKYDNGSMEAAIAYCDNCDCTWDADQFDVINDMFYDYRGVDRRIEYLRRRYLGE